MVKPDGCRGNFYHFKNICANLIIGFEQIYIFFLIPNTIKNIIFVHSEFRASRSFFVSQLWYTQVPDFIHLDTKWLF